MPINVTYEAENCVTLEEFAREASELAKAFSHSIKVRFRGIEMYVSYLDTPEDVLTRFRLFKGEDNKVAFVIGFVILAAIVVSIGVFAHWGGHW